MIDLIKKKQGFILLTVLVFILKLVFIFNTDNALVGDAQARLYWIFHFDQLPSFWNVVGLDWPPFYFWFNWLLPALTNEWHFTPRITHALCYLGTVWLLYFIVKEQLNEKTANIVFVLALLSPPHNLFSSFTLSSGVFAFFLLLAIYLNLKFLDRGRKQFLIYGAIVWAAVIYIRFEGWYFCTFFSLWNFWISIKRREYLFIFYVIILAIPVLSYMNFSMIAYGEPLRGLTFSDYQVKAEYTNFFRPNLTRLLKINLGFPYLLLIPGYLSLMYFSFKKRNILALCFFINFTLLLFKVFNETLLDEPRYFLLPALISLPFVIEILRAKIKIRQWALVGCVFLSMIATYFELSQGYLSWMKFKYRPEIVETAKFVEENLKNKFIYLDIAPFFQSNSFLVLSKRVREKEELCFGAERGWLDEGVSQWHLDGCFDNRKEVYVVKFDDGKLGEYMIQKPNALSEFGYQSEVIFRTKKAEVLKLTKN